MHFVSEFFILTLTDLSFNLVMLASQRRLPHDE